MNAKEWREAGGYTVVFRLPDVLLYDGTNGWTLPVGCGEWMEADDLDDWKPLDMRTAAGINLQWTAEACYCHQLSDGDCDFCTGCRPTPAPENPRGRLDYEERREARIDRLHDRAERMRQESAALHQQARKMADVIPFGQPILVGHHSERSDRNYRARIERKFIKGVEAYRESQRAESAAASAERNHAISSRDPEALSKLLDKLADLEADQARMKAINAAHKRFVTKPASLDRADLSEEDKAFVRLYKPAYSWEPHPYPPYRLSNNNANIKRVRERIAELQQPVEAAREDEEIGGVTIRENEEWDSVELHFPGKPSSDVLHKLKSNGWRWARQSCCWYKKRNDWTRHLAREIVGGMVTA